MGVTAFHRTLEQELSALARGISLECLVCGEFVLHEGAAIRCPECKSLRVDFPQVAHHSLLTNLALGLSAEVGLVERDYYCQQCHFTWPKEGSEAGRVRRNMAPYYFIEGIDESTRPRRSAK